MNKYIAVLDTDKYNNETIELVKKSILIAEEWISTPSSTKIKSEIVHEVNKIYKEGMKNDN